MRAILTYHSIDESGSPISVPAVVFEQHRRWLTGGSVDAVSLDDLFGYRDPKRDAVAVTFDDGFVNVRQPLELLLDAGIAPTLFVVTKHVGRANDWGGRDQPGIPRLPLMTWDDLGALSARGLKVEAHSRTHPHLSRLSPALIDDELGGCVEDLRSHLGVESTCVAYPYGDVDDDIARRAARWFTCGVTTDLAMIGRNDRPLRLPRLDMYYYRAPGAIESWGSVGFGVRVTAIAMRRRVRAMIPGVGR